MPSDGMIFYYGDYEHQKGEVYPRTIEVRPQATQQGVRWSSLHRMQIAGDFCAAPGVTLDAEAIGERITELQDAYLFDYQDCGFKLSDGTETPHKLVNDDDDNLSGNIIRHRSWDHVTEAEYAATRSFSVTIDALFRESYKEIVFFKEQVTRRGTGGPLFKTFTLFDGTPVKQILTTHSKVFHVQRGTVIGLNQFPSYPGPLWPSEEQVWLRTITQHSPTFHGDLSFTKGTHYRIDYTYFFERPSAQSLPPNNWITGAP